ncbi:putative siroheme synthase [Xylona heveae TC161]|uniref:Putative siroheme synthase n=1 Tax=Xylona heveae (strain CBS 132557 / TC161) TaxID=1328760 RepID=A0A164ZL93_XYLHT|nr:putative siroheme synthase [Xylona heveae TC161]KZF19235.1 putative siroheme synthase [Xylona heveae TC161]
MTPALLTAVDSTSHVHLIIGSNPLAAARCTRSVHVGARPKLIAPANAELHYSVQKRIEDGEVEWIQREFQEDDLQQLGREEIDRVVDAVFVTLSPKDPLSAHISSLCRRLRIPVNVADAPNLCTFTLLSTHTDGPLQIGITTSGRGCKLSSRIRREIAAALPKGLGDAVERLGTVRRRIWEEDHRSKATDGGELEVEEDETGQSATFNQLVQPEDEDAIRSRRMRWLSQICEYWPLRRLASISDKDVDAVLQSYTGRRPSHKESANDLTRRGLMVLAGSGPGNPDLLTTATHKAILAADLILADKLVPAPVLDLVPRRTPVYIARKFPGNADKAQEELLEMGLEGLRAGKVVVRLKQGDPYIYGRGAEEYDFFRAHGYTPVVLPGITSAFSAPLFAAIPPTHRGVADQILVCTGTGRKGAAPDPPAYVKSRTVVFLMALHRLGDLVDSLVNFKPTSPVSSTATGAWPASTPCAVIERASCPDQRVIRTTLEYVCAAVEEEGSRPPGLLVVGNSCDVLMPIPATKRKWVVEDGFKSYDDLMAACTGVGDLSALDSLKEVEVQPES